MFQAFMYTERLLLATYLGTKFPIASHLCLYQNDYIPTPLTTLGDLNECDFDGYARAESAAAYLRLVNPDRTISILSQEPAGRFEAAGILVPQTAYGCFVLNAAGGLVLVRSFDTPVLLSISGDALVVDWPGLVVLNQFGADIPVNE